MFNNVYIRLDKVMSIDHIEKYEAVFDQMNDVSSSNSKQMRENEL